MDSKRQEPESTSKRESQPIKCDARKVLEAGRVLLTSSPDDTVVFHANVLAAWGIK